MDLVNDVGAVAAAADGASPLEMVLAADEDEAEELHVSLDVRLPLGERRRGAKGTNRPQLHVATRRDHEGSRKLLDVRCGRSGTGCSVRFLCRTPFPLLLLLLATFGFRLLHGVEHPLFVGHRLQHFLALVLLLALLTRQDADEGGLVRRHGCCVWLTGKLGVVGVSGRRVWAVCVKESKEFPRSTRPKSNKNNTRATKHRRQYAYIQVCVCMCAQMQTQPCRV